APQAPARRASAARVRDWIMRPLSAVAALLILVPLLSAAGEPRETMRRPPPLLIDSVTVIDGNGGAPQREMTVLIDNGRIAELRPAARAGHRPAGALEIDGSGRFLLPGFIDSNVHATVYGNA